MVAVEVYTGRVPFQEELPGMSASRVLKGERPEIPQDAERTGLTREIWEFLERCWHQNPKKRPTMKDVVKKWRRFVDSEDAGVVNDARTFPVPVPALLDLPRRTPPTTGPSCSQPEGSESLPSESFLPGGYRSEVLIYTCRGREKQEKTVFRTVLIPLPYGVYCYLLRSISEADPPSTPPFRISLSRLNFRPPPLDSRLDSSPGVPTTHQKGVFRLKVSII